MAEDPRPQLVGRTLGPYPVLSLLGVGGMGEVYRAHDPRLGRDVAIKVLPPDLTHRPEALARFEREARAIATLSHPNILGIHDVGTDRGIAYAVMELLDGETLRQRLRASPIPWRKAVGIAIQIADGLAAAHAQGIVHRDLKPENIALTSSGLAKILDFGLARILQRPQTPAASTSPTSRAGTIGLSAPGAVMGTIGYMSPEQARGEDVGPASDIFALAACCTKYSAAAHRSPKARPPRARPRCCATIPRRCREGSDTPPALETLVFRCLEKRAEGPVPLSQRHGLRSAGPDRIDRIERWRSGVRAFVGD